MELSSKISNISSKCFWYFFYFVLTYKMLPLVLTENFTRLLWKVTGFKGNKSVACVSLDIMRKPLKLYKVGEFDPLIKIRGK